MRSELKYKFDYSPKQKVLYKKHLGNVTKEDIFNSWDWAIAENLIPVDTEGFIIDIRNTHLNIEMREVKSIPRYFDAHKDIFKDKKLAVIVDSPSEIVFPIMIEHMKKDFYLRPFTTEGAALTWILGEKV